MKREKSLEILMWILKKNYVWKIQLKCSILTFDSIYRFSAVCPQRLPDIANETAALERMPRGRLDYLKRLLPYLKNQSEDCLYLNIYAPIQGKPTQIFFCCFYCIFFLIFLFCYHKCKVLLLNNENITA